MVRNNSNSITVPWYTAITCTYTYCNYYLGQKRKPKEDDNLKLLDIFREMEEREIAWEKLLKLELEMEEKRQQQEQEQDDRMQNMFSTFLQQMSTFMPRPQSSYPQGLQTYPYPDHSPTSQ